MARCIISDFPWEGQSPPYQIDSVTQKKIREKKMLAPILMNFFLYVSEHSNRKKTLTKKFPIFLRNIYFFLRIWVLS